MADEILDKLEEKALEIIKSSNQELRAKLTDRETEELVKTIALGAIKYSLLRVARETTIFYDMKGSISLEGNSGPYLQYTYARTQSVLRKAQAMPFKDTVFKGINQNKEESALLRSFIHFSEVIASAAKNYSPNLLCNYLYDLASKFNLFYARHRILDINTERLESVALQDQKHGILESHKSQVTSNKKEKLSTDPLRPSGSETSNLQPTTNFRLALTAATGQILKNGLSLLGISAPERM